MSNVKAYFYPHNTNSQGLAAITAAGVDGEFIRIKRANSRFRGSPDKTVVNWGCTTIDNPEVHKCRVLNDPTAVALASNKLAFFNRMHTYATNASIDQIIPPFTSDKNVAFAWLKKGSTVFGRKVLNGSSGDGIIEFKPNDIETVDDIEDAPLYVTYIPKKEEYRVHVVNGVAIDVQMKRRSSEVPLDQINWRIRSYDNGFVFCREDITVSSKLTDAALRAVTACGLDFGAVDIVYNQKRDKYYVLEVNTAPGAVATTADRYAAAFAGNTQPSETVAPTTPNSYMTHADRLYMATFSNAMGGEATPSVYVSEDDEDEEEE